MMRVDALVLTDGGVHLAGLRTVVLLLGAMACVTTAVFFLLVNRIKLSRQPKHTSAADAGMRAPVRQLSRVRTVGLTTAALVSAAAFVAAIWLPTRDSEQIPEATPQPELSPITLPPASALEPGAGIYIDYPDGSGGMGCTAGFLVRTSAGQHGLLTAGHCNRARKPSKVTMNLAGILPYATLGTFNRTVIEGSRTDQHDIGLIVLDGEDVPQTSSIAASLPVSGVTTELRIGQQLCKYGMSTGQEECGQVLDITDSKVVFAAAGQCGDSGGPVYAVERDGTASAVGIDIRGGNPRNPKAGCSAPAKFSVAELVQPWLHKWNLTVVTNERAGPS
jgi:hypothetical protein